MARPKHQILIVDDEEDIHAVTQLSLRGLKFKGKRCQFLSAHTGAQAQQMVRDNPAIAVVLLDVVMETDHAGLDACRHIRDELGNQFVRIILRTGQPGSSPEKETIDNYDIDGYLSKAEITSTKLYSSVRTALKAWDELMELERHKASLALIHECAMSVRSFEPLDLALDRILGSALSISKCRLAVLSLDTFSQSETANNYLMHLASLDVDEDHIDEHITGVKNQVNRQINDADDGLITCDSGVAFAFALHRELGHGWIYLEGVELDELQQQAMSLLCGHAANALYSTVAQSVLSAARDQDDAFDVLAI